MKSDFKEMTLENWLQKNIDYVAYKKPTIVQKNIIPQILSDKNVLAISKTGTGKTASFVLPILSELSKNPFGLFALILEPTHELVLQVEEKLKILSTGFNLRMCCIIGGGDYTTQLKELSLIPHIIVATPGRLVSFIENNYIPLISNLKYLVLDEFDQLMNNTIKKDLDYIINNLPEKRRTLFFSATMPFNKEDLEKYYTKNDNKDNIFIFDNAESDKKGEIQNDTLDPSNKILKYAKKLTINEDIKLKYILLPQKLKENYLIHILRNVYKGLITIIFSNTVKQCNFLFELCKLFDLKVNCLHAKLTQKQRQKNLQRFKEGTNNILITTDISARGLDIKECELVINFDMPYSAVNFVHRAGRTGRINNKGVCLSFVSQYDIQLLMNIEDNLKINIDEMKVDEDEITSEIGLVSKGIKLTKTKLIKI